MAGTLLAGPAAKLADAWHVATTAVTTGTNRWVHISPYSPQTWVILATYSMWLVFMWGLPQWSHVFNDQMMMFNHQWIGKGTGSGPHNHLCMTPPEEMECSNGDRFEDLPIVQWRMKVSGRRNVGCGCGQGVIGEGSCAQDGAYMMFTLSSYVSTAPATGLFIGLVSPAVVSMWWVMARFHQLTQMPLCFVMLQSLSLLTFQVCWALFAFGQDCSFQGLHLTTTWLFHTALCVHNYTYIVLACRYGTSKSNVLCIVVAAAVVALGGAALTIGWQISQFKRGWPASQYAVEHAFFYAECLMLTGCFSVGPALMLFGEVEVPFEVPFNARGDTGNAEVGRGSGGAALGDKELPTLPLLPGPSADA